MRLFKKKQEIHFVDEKINALRFADINITLDAKYKIFSIKKLSELQDIAKTQARMNPINAVSGIMINFDDELGKKVLKEINTIIVNDNAVFDVTNNNKKLDITTHELLYKINNIFDEFIQKQKNVTNTDN